MKKRASRSEKGAAINAALASEYPEAKCSLDFRSPFELLVATILSAQCTDERVNIVMPDLMRKYGSPMAMSEAPVESIEKLVKSTGFFHNKAKSLKGMAQAIVQDHGGEVPSTIEQLTRLPGVGRKTANVVLGNCFATPGITVDTHVGRVTVRLGLSRQKNPEKIERDLMAVIPRDNWTRFSHRVIFHGRKICRARKPLCEQCLLSQWCTYYTQLPGRGKRSMSEARGPLDETPKRQNNSRPVVRRKQASRIR